jgi:LmbE family N-acetylglucosaminyl deacetylase
MEKILFGVFAHPDDEAFGPSGTLIKRVKDGEKLHLVLVTDGQAGMNPDNDPNLGKTRLKEWRKAGKRMGAVALHSLGYQDGELSNGHFHQIASDVEKIVHETCDSTLQPVELSFTTLDPNGLTGHLDHVAVSMITSYLFYRLKNDPPENAKLGTLDYFCYSQDQVPAPDTGFVYMPAGHGQHYINRTVDVSDVLEEKIAVIREHQSQRSDAENLLSRKQQMLATEHFHRVS